jgi:hypothetical protein
VRSALDELLAGGTSNAGAMLGPLGIRYVVAGDGDLPPATADRLDAQVDLDRVPAGGLIIYRNAAELPTAFVGTAGIWPPSPEDADLAEVAERPIVPVDDRAAGVGRGHPGRGAERPSRLTSSTSRASKRR